MYKKIFYNFIFCFFSGAILFLGGCSEDKKQEEVVQPNIILIFVDDLGYGDLGCYGNTDIPTPHIDQLAREGIRFTDFHVTSSVCGPSRVSLLTGMYQQRLGVFWNPDLWPSNGWEIQDTLNLMPNLMDKAGYVTCHIGKWNLDKIAQPYFDEAYDVMVWKGAYYPEEDGIYMGVNSPDFKLEPHGWGPPRPGAEYLTDRLTRQAIGFIERHRAQPFFLYLAYNAVHTPLQADENYKEIFKELENEPNRLYAGMVASLDQNVGRIRDLLNELGLEENTIVVFTSDNGPAMIREGFPGWRDDWPETLLGSAGPLRGHKAQRYEGGHRVPFIIRWPGKLGINKVYTKTASTLDLLPTFCEAAGYSLPGEKIVDGVDLIPYITGENLAPPHDTLFWMTYDQGAVRLEDWKLIINRDTSLELYNLQEDLGEKNDLSEANPDTVKKLLQAWKEWNDPFPDPISDRKQFNVE